MAAALSRRAHAPSLGYQAASLVYDQTPTRIVSMMHDLIWDAIRIAADLQVRAGDAIYVALAQQLKIPLVTWDNEQQQKAGSVIMAYSPQTFPF